jgi:hypothetical protein
VVGRDAVVREIDGGFQVCRALGGQRREVHIVGLQRRRVDLQLVELGRIAGHSLTAAGLHLVQDLRNDAAYVMAIRPLFPKETAEPGLEIRCGCVECTGHWRGIPRKDWCV